MMKKIVLGLLAIATVQFSCSRSSDNVGPDICPSDNFTYGALVVKNNSDNSTSALNLQASYADINITFSEIASFNVELKGLTSGAEYVYSGKAAAVNLAWYGNSTNGVAFVKDEVISYKVTNLCRQEPLGSGQIQLVTIVGFNGFGLKASNFEDGANIGQFAGGASTTFNVGPVASGTPGYEVSPQGANYFSISAATDPGNPQWYFGGIGFSDMTPATFTALGTDPTRIYLNFYTKGQLNSQTQMVLLEKLHGSTLTRIYTATVSTGWQKFSVKLSDIGIIQPSAISSLSVNLGASTHRDESAHIDLDCVIFTYDKPL
ncbi:MAG: hypothetical protein H7282_12425 [Cytophagaceae bacterium]|nr:hypothetical protein [Cytophagaceae bacterium]